jgi:hypothetical protein
MLGIDKRALGGIKDGCSDGLEDGFLPCDKLGFDKAAEVAIYGCSLYAVKEKLGSIGQANSKWAYNGKYGHFELFLVPKASERKRDTAYNTNSFCCRKCNMPLCKLD